MRVACTHARTPARTVLVEQSTAVGAVEVGVVLELQVAQLEHAGDELVERHDFRLAEPDHQHRVLTSQQTHRARGHVHVHVHTAAASVCVGVSRRCRGY